MDMYNYNVVKNADNPPGLVSGILERFCSFSRFFSRISCSLNFLLLALVLKGLLGLIDEPKLETKELEAKDV